MFRKLAYIGDVKSANNNARREDIQEKYGTSNVEGQQPQSSGMITKLNDTRLDTKVWSRNSVGAESLLLLVRWDADVTENGVGRQLSPEKLKTSVVTGKRGRLYRQHVYYCASYRCADGYPTYCSSS